MIHENQDDIRPAAGGHNAVIACQGIELVLNLLGCHILGAEIVEISGCYFKQRIVVGAVIKDICHLEKVVGVVGGIKHFHAIVGRQFCNVLVIVNKHRLDRLHLRVAYIGEELACGVAVGD